MAVFEDGEFDGDDAGDFDGAAEGDFAVALCQDSQSGLWTVEEGGRTREMQISNTELRPLYMNRQIYLTAPRQILDIAVPAMFRPTRNSSCALFANLGLDLFTGRTGVHGFRLGRLCDNAGQRGGGNQFCFTFIPLGEDLGGGCAAQNARVDETSEADARDVSGGTEYAFEIPDCFCSA